ncbi:MAG: hypothetical protein IPL78_34715 [Chloroflexi bacterium]|nr:hypothetical protein [Chloroflexota bacterium]
MTAAVTTPLPTPDTHELDQHPEARVMFTSVWTGEEFIVWGGGVLTGWTYYQTGGRYDPATDTWTPTSLINAPEERARFASVDGKR